MAKPRDADAIYGSSISTFLYILHKCVILFCWDKVPREIKIIDVSPPRESYKAIKLPSRRLIFGL